MISNKVVYTNVKLRNSHKTRYHFTKALTQNINLRNYFGSY